MEITTSSSKMMLEKFGYKIMLCLVGLQLKWVFLLRVMKYWLRHFSTVLMRNN